MASTSIPVPRGAVRRTPKRLLALRGDEHLVGRIRSGDEGAFEVIYERHAASILSFCRHMLSDADEAEDAVQQVFLSAHRDLLRDCRRIRVKPWLYTIARNRCVSILRMRREQATSEPEAITAGLGEEVRQRAELRELVSDLRTLPDDQRAALVLTELGDLSHAEVAEVLGCGKANVKGLVFRARTGLMERRAAREAPCEEIREELANARYGALRRGRLRHHVATCPGCQSYLDEVRRQRRMMALVLPVVPSLGLKRSVLAATGLSSGGGAAAGGGGTLATAGLSAAGMSAAGPAGTALVAKVAMVGVLAGSVGLAGEATLDRSPQSPAKAPAVSAKGGPALPSHREPAVRDSAETDPRAQRRHARDASDAQRRAKRSAQTQPKGKAIGQRRTSPHPDKLRGAGQTVGGRERSAATKTAGRRQKAPVERLRRDSVPRGANHPVGPARPPARAKPTPKPPRAKE